MSDQESCPKTSRKKYVVGGIIAAAVLSVGASVFAFGGGGFRKHLMFMRVVSKLNLTSDQKARLRLVFREAHRDRAANKAKMKQLHGKLLGLMKQNKPNKQQLDQLVDQGFDAAKRIARSKTVYLLRAHAILTPQQRKLLLTELQKLHKRMKRFRKCSGHGKPGFVPPFLR